MDKTEITEYKPSLLGFVLSWIYSSSTMLRTVEKRILSCLKSAYRGWYVDIGPVVGSSDKIWTISLNEDSPFTPLVLLHGLGSGVALWCMNLDAFAVSRPVYAMDILGFGRSSRPSFSNDPIEAEQQLVKSIEEWRHEMKLDKVIFLGHSLGGFIAASYAINYPLRVKHLILADPWGFPERPDKSEHKNDIPLWIKAITFLVQPFNPLWAIRFCGPFGQMLIDKIRPDLKKKFAPVVPDENLISQYIYLCNSQTPSGESAFHSMTNGFGWAKNPIINRIQKLHDDIPVTLIYGARSWVDNSTGNIIKTKRTNSYVNIQVISGAGHHVYADKPDIFNKHVIDACALADGKRDHETSIEPENLSSDIQLEKNNKMTLNPSTPSISTESS